MSFTQEELIDLLRLDSIPGIGSHKLRKLVGYFQSPSRVFEASPAKLTGVVKLEKKMASRIAQFDGRRAASQQFEKIQGAGGEIVSFWDDRYPALLRQIYDPPTILYVKGDPGSNRENAISIVGSRRPSNYGRRIAEKLCFELAALGLTIVSGLAYGIDTVAHQQALRAKSRTLAVLGTGVDVIYPATNRALAEKIVENGALVSEFPIGTKPDWTNFPRRNRIIAGLTYGTVVVEAAEKSGALITASMAVEQNREVFAVPGNIDNPMSRGGNNLIREGARIVTSVDDILEELSANLDFPPGRNDSVPSVELSKEEKSVLEFLSNEPLHVDALAKSAGKSTAAVLSLLLSLELKNVVKQHPGKLFVRV